MSTSKLEQLKQMRGMFQTAIDRIDESVPSFYDVSYLALCLLEVSEKIDTLDYNLRVSRNQSCDCGRTR